MCYFRIMKDSIPQRIIRVFLVAFLLVAGLVSVAAQYSADPLNQVYEWFDLWEGKGYLRDMPVFRPYPEAVLIPALERVARVGDPESQAVAKRFLLQLDDPLDLELFIVQETRQKNDETALKGGVGVTINGRISETITAAGSITGVLLDDKEAEMMPRGQRSTWDIVEDWSTVPVFGRDVAALTQTRSSFAWGTESLYLHTGIMRRSFGPLHDDGVVMSPYARQAPGFVASWRRGNFRWSSALLTFTATQPYQELTPFNSGEENISVVSPVNDPDLLFSPTENPGKFVFIHDFRWAPLPWLTLAFFESATWGPRFEIAYLVPVKWAFHAQNTIGLTDSSKMGISIEGRPRNDLHIPFVLYVDDASFNDIVRLNFDTKLTIAAHTGIIWTPLHHFVRRLSVDYLAVFPYMYTHESPGGIYSGEPLYSNYTHRGESLGPDLRPNSDRLTVQGTFRPLKNLDVTFRGRLMRHGNASEGVEGLGLPHNDGGLLDDGRFYRFAVDENDELVATERGRKSFHNDRRFMEQEIIERTWQGGMDIAYNLPVKAGRRFGFSVDAGYTFEFVQDPLLFQPTGTTELRDGANVVLWETVAGDNEVNHYGRVRFRILY
jgi:hypothetical protein